MTLIKINYTCDRLISANNYELALDGKMFDTEILIRNEFTRGLYF